MHYFFWGKVPILNSFSFFFRFHPEVVQWNVVLYWVSAGVLGWSAMLVVASTSVVEPWRVLAWTVDLFVNGPLGWARENDDSEIPFFLGERAIYISKCHEWWVKWVFEDHDFVRFVNIKSRILRHPSVHNLVLRWGEDQECFFSFGERSQHVFNSRFPNEFWMPAIFKLPFGWFPQHFCTQQWWHAKKQNMKLLRATWREGWPFPKKKETESEG